MAERRREKKGTAKLLKAFALLLLLLAGIVTLARGAFLIHRPIVPFPESAVLSGRGEKFFFGWSYRDPGLAGLFSRIEVSLPRGEIVLLAIPPGRHDPGWLHVMALYFLPHQYTIAVLEQVPGGPLPAGVTVVAIDSSGNFRIMRRRGAASP